MATISKGIVISTSEYSKLFYEDLMASIRTDYPIYICWEGIGRPKGSFELGAIKKGTELFDEFIYLHDTLIIKDNCIFDNLFAIEGTVALTPNFYHYFGKYTTKDMPRIPECKCKKDAIRYEITWYTNPYKVYDPELPFLSNVYEKKHCRQNMILENQYIKKFKGNWGQNDMRCNQGLE